MLGFKMMTVQEWLSIGFRSIVRGAPLFVLKCGLTVTRRTRPAGACQTATPHRAEW